MKILLTHFYAKPPIGGIGAWLEHFLRMMRAEGVQIDVVGGFERFTTREDWKRACSGYNLLLFLYPGCDDKNIIKMLPDIPRAMIVYNTERYIFYQMRPGIPAQMENCHLIFMRERVRDRMLAKYQNKKLHTVLGLPFDAKYLDPEVLLTKKVVPPIVLFPSRITMNKGTKTVLTAVPDIDARVVFGSRFATERKRDGRLKPHDMQTIAHWGLIVEARKAGAVFLNGYPEKQKPTLFGCATLSLDLTQMQGEEDSLQYVTLEAMQYGTVPVMYRAWENVMVAEENFEPLDEPQDLVPTINGLLKDSARLRQYVFTNMEFIRKHHSYAALAPQYVAFFKEICK